MDGISFTVAVQADINDFAGWQPDQIEAFMVGCGKVVAAMNEKPPPKMLAIEWSPLADATAEAGRA